MINSRRAAHKLLAATLLVGLLASTTPEKTDLFPFQDVSTTLYGYKNSKGNIVIPPQFFQAYSFSEHGIANVVINFQDLTDHTKKNSYFCRINKRGHIIEQAFFFDNGWDYYQEGLARYVQNGKVGFSNECGEHVIEACFDIAFPFRNGVTAVGNECKPFIPNKEAHCQHLAEEKHEYGGKWGVVDKQGDMLVPLVHKDAQEALQTLYFANKAPDNTWLETTGKITKRSYNRKDKMWRYECTFLGSYRNLDGENVKIAYRHQATSKQKILKRADVRIKYIAGDPKFAKLIGPVK